ncbi:hypothetical protein [Enhygromyxa salina]|uniref:Uncharacterized protein n=1 Tax=Enhygromyxa salina TaxID=215803 RepID=A0A2S9YV60_9BACT|nr:hypothetical protein [Enhygromyxa salina]PRQ08970.1 hypothetical protein ENSA7_13690 [Enhygromyxa salina]
MEALDPATLDFDQLARASARARGDAWRAAGAHGVDLLLLERTLALTPAERMQQLEDALRLMAGVGG